MSKYRTRSGVGNQTLGALHQLRSSPFAAENATQGGTKTKNDIRIKLRINITIARILFTVNLHDFSTQSTVALKHMKLKVWVC